MTKQRFYSFSLLIFVSIIWGVAAPIIKFTGDTFSPALFLTYRFFISSLITLWYFATHRKQVAEVYKRFNDILAHSFFSIVLGLGLLFFGFQYTDAVTGALLSATGPMFAIIAGALFLKEKVTKTEIIGLAIALIGSGVITVPAGSFNVNFELLSLFGGVLIIVSRVFEAIGNVFTKRALDAGTAPQTISHASFLIGFFLLSLISLFTLDVTESIQTLVTAPLSAHLGVFFMALISGTLAYALYYKALKHLHLGEASMFSYITPLWATPVAVLWLGEPITPQFIIGAVIIACGVFIAERHRRRKSTYRRK